MKGTVVGEAKRTVMAISGQNKADMLPKKSFSTWHHAERHCSFYVDEQAKRIVMAILGQNKTDVLHNSIHEPVNL